MTDSVYALIGRNARHRRLELHLKTQDVADALEISRIDYLAMENGTKHIATPLLLGLTKILGVRAAYFFEGRNLETSKHGSAMARLYEILNSPEK